MSDQDDKLSKMAVGQEPPIDPEDTSPTGVFRRGMVAPETNPRQRKQGSGLVNILLSGGAVAITIVAALFYVQESKQPAPAPVVQATNAPLSTPTLPPTLSPTSTPRNGVIDNTVPADVVAELLMQPGDTAPGADKIYRQQNAYTIAPARSRDNVQEYTIQAGDTLDKIAQRFGLSNDTLIWNNDGIYVNRLFPGDTLTILPTDGIRYKTITDVTIQSIADKYKVSPYVIIDSDYNHLQNTLPSTLLPAGLEVMIPGGTSAEQAVYWDPGISVKNASGTTSGGTKGTVVTGGAGASANSQGEVSFGGGPGACGYQPNTGGSGVLRIPLPPGYQVVRGFYPGHTGIDLAMPTGTTVFAADGGTIIFAGWSNWGYGNTIVIAHGSMLTLYGHLSQIRVVCGQRVSGGQPIGAVGTTGNSSGPHLHFEIRPGAGEPVNPVGYLAF